MTLNVNLLRQCNAFKLHIKFVDEIKEIPFEFQA